MPEILGPRDSKEAADFAAAELLVDLQVAVKKVLRAKGRSQADLADIMGISPSAVSQILGSSRSLRLETIAKVFDALGARCDVNVDVDRLSVGLTLHSASTQLRPSSWTSVVRRREDDCDDLTVLPSNQNSRSGRASSWSSVVRAA